MKLHRYFARRYLFIFLSVFAIFAVMSALIDMIEQFRIFDRSSANFLQILHLTSLNVSGALYRTLPLIALLSALALFLALARSSELVIARAAGRSALVSLLAPVLVAFLLGIFAVAVLNPIVAATQKQYDALSNRLLSGTVSVISLSSEGLWMRQGNREGQTVIHAEGSNGNGTLLSDVSFQILDPSALVIRRIEGETARLEPGAWVIEGAKIWELARPEAASPAANPEANAREVASTRVVSDLTEARIRDSFGSPETIPIWELPAFIRQLDLAGFSSRLHRVWVQAELSQPLLLAAMVLIGAAFTMRPVRFGGTGIKVLFALGMGFGTYFIRNFAQILGESGQLPVALATWAPPFAACLLALTLILHWEDG